MSSQLHAKPLRTFVPNTNQTMVRPQHVPVSTAKSLKIVGTTLGDSVRSNIYNSSHQARENNIKQAWGTLNVTRQSSQSSSRTTQRSSPRTLRDTRAGQERLNGIRNNQQYRGLSRRNEMTYIKERNNRKNFNINNQNYGKPHTRKPAPLSPTLRRDAYYTSRRAGLINSARGRSSGTRRIDSTSNRRAWR